MIAVRFEVEPHAGRPNDCRALSAGLAEEWQRIDGFLGVERFRSLSDPGKLLSLSFWGDEDAVQRWRHRPSHRRAPHAGRTPMFRDDRLRVAQAFRDDGLHARTEAPVDSRHAHALPSAPP